MDERQCDLFWRDNCQKPVRWISTVQTANYRESSLFCDDHKDCGYVPSKPYQQEVAK